MFLNSHHIIKFAMKKFKLTKKDLAKEYLNRSQYELSRKKPPTIDVEHWYKRLFNVKEPESAAKTNGFIEDTLLDEFRDYLVKLDCIREANFITSSIKKATQQGVDVNYDKIWSSLLNRANMQANEKGASSPRQHSESSELKKDDVNPLNPVINAVPQDNETQSVQELTLPEQPIFSDRTIKATRKFNSLKPLELLDSVRDDLARPLNPIKKE